MRWASARAAAPPETQTVKTAVDTEAVPNTPLPQVVVGAAAEAIASKAAVRTAADVAATAPLAKAAADGTATAHAVSTAADAATATVATRTATVAAAGPANRATIAVHPQPSADPKRKQQAEVFWNSIREPLHGEFRLGGEVKRYMFVPRGYLSHSSKLRDTILLHWNLKAPNLIIGINPSFTAPCNLVEPLAQESADFQADFEAAKALTLRSSPEQARARQQGVNGIVNQIFQRRVEGTMSNVAVALEKTNSWLFATSPCGNAYLMGRAIGKASTKPIWLQVDDCGTLSTFLADRPGLPWAQKLRDGAQALYMPCKEPVCLADLDNEEKCWTKAKDGETTCIRGNFSSTGATHFIFSADADTFNVHLFAPTGWMIVNGGLCKTTPLLMQCIRDHRPAVLMKNSGRAAHQFSILMEKVLEHKQKNSSTSFSPVLLSDWASHCGLDLHVVQELVDSMDADTLGTPCTETVVVVNPQVEAPGDILLKLSASFASVHNGIQEFGEGNTDQSTVMFAWKIHGHFQDNAVKQGRNARIFGLAAMTLTFMSTTLAVCMTLMQHQRERDLDALPPWLYYFMGTTSWHFLDWVMLIIPATATLILMMLSFKDFQRKWMSLEASAAQVLHEIYTFRMRVGRYGLVHESGSNMSVVQQQPRAIFTDTLKELLRAQSASMNTDHLDSREAHRLASGWLSQHRRGLYPNSLSRSAEDAGSVRDLKAAAVDTDTEPLLANAEAGEPALPSDGLGSLSVEAYMAERTLPLLRDLQAQAPHLSWQYTCCKFLGFLASSTASLLAAFRLTSLIPVAVALGVVANDLLQNGNTEARLTAANAAIAELNSCCLYWESAGIMERGMPQVRAYIVTCTEETALRVVGTWTKGARATVEVPPRKPQKDS